MLANVFLMPKNHILMPEKQQICAQDLQTSHQTEAQGEF